MPFFWKLLPFLLAEAFSPSQIGWGTDASLISGQDPGCVLTGLSKCFHGGMLQVVVNLESRLRH